MKRNWTRWAGLLVLGMLCAAAEADYFTYWTQLQAVNLTPYDIQITKTQWKYLDDDKPHVKAGDILPKADPNNPQQEPIQIGEVSRWSGGVALADSSPARRHRARTRSSKRTASRNREDYATAACGQ